MTLTLTPVTLSDFTDFQSYSHTSNGDLSAPIMPLSWPLSPDALPEATHPRNVWSLAQQKHIFQHDPTAHFLKVTDESLNPPEAIALARWHFYPAGYIWDEATRLRELEGPEGFASDSQKNMSICALTRLFESRVQRFQGKPCWVLCTLKTREGYRKRGAGGMLVKWGIERAEEDGCVAFVEGSTMGTPVYLSYGFEQTGVLDVDFKSIGMEMSVGIALLKYTPERLREG